jgi:STE24 endopeptidase
MLAAMLFAPVSTFLHFVTNTITRRLEYDADAFAVKLSQEHARNLKRALVSIHEKNLVSGFGDIHARWTLKRELILTGLGALASAATFAHEQALTLTDKLYSALHHNHPTLIERLSALDKQLNEDQKKDQ